MENWSNGFLRQCRQCDSQVVGTTATFTNHLMEAHGLTLTDYTLEHGNNDNKVESHACRLCNEVVEHTHEGLREHVEGHGINLEHYYHKFIGSTNADATNAHLITAGGQKGGGQQQQQQQRSLLKSNLQKQQQMPKIVSVTAAGAKSTLAAAAAASAGIRVRKNHWANGCSYQCFLCKGQKYPEEFMFKKHIMNAHSMSQEEYQNNFGDPAIVKQLHICQVGENEPV